MDTDILSSARPAIHARAPAGRRQGSNLQNSQSMVRSERHLDHGVLTRVKQYQPIRTNQVNPTAARLAAQQEHELPPSRVVELVHELLSLGHRHRAVKTEVAIPIIETLSAYCKSDRKEAHVFDLQSFSNKSRVCV